MKSRLIFIVGWVLVLSSFAGAQADFHWVEYGANPVFGQAAGGPKAYYPSVCFDAEEFSDHGIRAKYKMWYGSASGQVGLAWSDDGIIWNDAGQVVGNVHYHCKVLYDAAGFGSGIYYKMWYADPGVWPYSKQTIRYAESMDGFTWQNDRPIAQDEAYSLITGNYEWWYGSYGPGAVLYHSDGYTDWHDGDPLEHKYVMYYDVAPQNCIAGETEATALAYSVDGIHWRRYGDQPVIVSGAEGSWDSEYVYAWSVIEDQEMLHMWYSGGVNSSHAGIGYATSPDGINWTAHPDNPVFHIGDGVAWRNARCYTPAVLRIEATYRMWFAGEDSLTGQVSIGYAETVLPPVELALDIMPGNARNVIPSHGRGLLGMILYGSQDGNLDDVQINTIRLEGMAPEKVKFRDVGAPEAVNAKGRSHNRRSRDGFTDLVLKFRLYEVLDSLIQVSESDSIWLTLTGSLKDGRRIVGRDYVKVMAGKRGRRFGMPGDHPQDKPKPKAGQFYLSGNIPNPFNPITTIRYDLPTEAQVNLTVYDMRGRVIEQLVDQRQVPGIYSVNWNASRYSSGVYFYRIQIRYTVDGEVRHFQQVRKCLLTK